MRTITDYVQQLNVKAPWACVWIGATAQDATQLQVEYPWPDPDPQGAAEAAAKVEALAAAIASGQKVTVTYGDDDTNIRGVILTAGTAPQPPLDDRYLRSDFSQTDPRYVRIGNFDAFDARYLKSDFSQTDPRYLRSDFSQTDPRYLRSDFSQTDPRYLRSDFSQTDPRYLRSDFSQTDLRYVRINDFSAFDPRYLPASTVHDNLSGSGIPRHHIVLSGTASVNVPASGIVNVTPAQVGFPSNTATRSPIAVRASAWLGTPTTVTNLLLASVGPFNGTAWPVRVHDPSGAFNTGAAIVELAVRLDP